MHFLCSGDAKILLYFEKANNFFIKLKKKNKDNATRRVNDALKRWCSANGIPTFTLYAARHSWASIARSKAKVEKSLIDECLVHVGDFKLTDIYAERDWDLINEANQKVLDLFEW